MKLGSSAIVLVAVALTLVGCKPEPEKQGSAAEGRSEALKESVRISASPVRLETRQLEPYGRYLTDNNGRALYMFMADTNNPAVSNCDGDCVEDWPPLTADEDVIAGPDINSELVGRIEREAGVVQVTYNGWPLYYYQVDSSGKTVEGQDLMSHGAEWYLLSPDGNPNKTENPPKMETPHQ